MAGDEEDIDDIAARWKAVWEDAEGAKLIKGSLVVVSTEDVVQTWHCAPFDIATLLSVARRYRAEVERLRNAMKQGGYVIDF